MRGITLGVERTLHAGCRASKRLGLMGALALCCATSGNAQTAASAAQFSGQLRLQWDQRDSNSAGPLAAANALQPGTAPVAGNGATLETELRANGAGLSSVVTLRQQRLEGSALDSRAWINELYASHDGGAWQFSVGKKIVAWDVGYAFRPNDMVAQEERRTLLSSTLEGRPLLMAEHFSADTAWSWVWVNPTSDSGALGANEPALALRAYRRDGSVDWHAFARLGAHSGASVGAAVAWVASDALELHASARYLQRLDSQAIDPAISGVTLSNPWRPRSESGVKQLLLGGTWTNEHQLSLLAEAWWDGAALADAQWETWAGRNAKLVALVGQGAPTPAVAGNLAWQAQAFSVSQNLRRSNLFVRLSWQHEGWQPALDLLYAPVDRGQVWTASLNWQGDRVQVQGGLRAYAGPASALLTQLPTRGMAYLASTWNF